MRGKSHSAENEKITTNKYCWDLAKHPPPIHLPIFCAQKANNKPFAAALNSQLWVWPPETRECVGGTGRHLPTPGNGPRTNHWPDPVGWTHSGSEVFPCRISKSNRGAMGTWVQICFQFCMIFCTFLAITLEDEKLDTTFWYHSIALCLFYRMI